MTRIAKMIEEMREVEEANEATVSRKIPVTIRLDDQSIWRLDLLLENFKGATRTSFSQNLVEESLVEALEALGYDMDTQYEMYIAQRRADREAK